MMNFITKFIFDYYYVFLLPFLSISVFYAMEYLSRGLDFFVDDSGVIRWRFLVVTAIIQFFVSIVITWSVLAIFESGGLEDYQTFKMIAIILLGSTPFNISILVWVAIKFEMYKLMRSRYKEDFKEEEIDILTNPHRKRQKNTQQSQEEKQEKRQEERIENE